MKKKLDSRPVARRTRQQSEAEMLKRLNEVKQRRKSEGDLTKPGSSGGQNAGGELVVLDESTEDELEVLEDCERVENMEGKEFVVLDDDDEDEFDHQVKEDDVGHENDGMISSTVGDIKVEENDSDYGALLSDEDKHKGVDYGALICDSEGDEDEEHNIDIDDEIVAISEETTAAISEEESVELECNSDKEDEDYIDCSDAESSEDQETSDDDEDSSKEESEVGEDDELEDDIVMEAGRKEEVEVEGDGEEDETEVRLKRKKRKGREIVSDKGKKNGDDDCEGKDDSFHGDRKPSCVAKRTKTHPTSEPVGVTMKRKKLGGVTNPLRADVQDQHGDDFICLDDCQIHHNSKGTGSHKQEIGKGTGSHKAEIGVQDLSAKKFKKRKRNHAYKEDEVVAILADSIFDQAEAPLEEKNEPVIKVPTLPLKFTFGVEESTPPEKSEEEKELEKLWLEFDMVLWSLNSNDNDNAKVEHEADVSPDVEDDTATLCRQGKHHLVLDEEIGIKCKYCSIVDLEIRYCVPPFCTNPSGRSARRDRASTQHNVLHGFNHQDSDSQPDYDPNNHEQGTVWDLIPGIGKGMHAHQREGFEFLWENIAGGINLDALKETTSSSGGSGCIISHAPGTGKTRLAIVFIQTYMKLYPTCRPVIIAPRSMLLNWEAEFQKWGVDTPFHNLNKENLSGKENEAAVNLLRRLTPHCSSASIRLLKLLSWKKETSILGISYGLFEKLSGEDKGKSRLRHMTEDDQVKKALLELPGLLVLDEGHTPRNKQSLIWKALSKVRTQRRIMLSGTPFQNNFDQLYNTLYLVNPKFADEITSKHNRAFHKKYGLREDESRGNWFSLTNPLGKVTDGRLEDARLKEVRKLIQPFVHVHKGTILQEKLSGLRESLVILEPVGLQKRLLDGLQNMKKKQLTFNLDNWISSVSVHPSLLKESSETEELQVDWDELKRLGKNPHASVKTHFLMELISLSESTNEKVLVFCQFLPPLNLICKQLKSRFGWAEGKEVLYMDGALSSNKRQSLINVFNDQQSISKVMLASTKACCEGISLVGASRVVLLDVVWNPAVETQAISRAYRLGQEKVVYVYHLVTSGEEEKYCRQVRKERLSELVFYSADHAGNEKKVSSDISDESKDRFLEAMVEHERLKDMFKNIIYEPKDSSLVKSFGLTDL